MITVHEESIPQVQEEAIRKILLDSAFMAFQNLVASTLKAELAQAASKALEASRFPNYSILSDEHLKQANRLKTCLEVIEEFRAREAHYVTYQLK